MSDAADIAANTVEVCLADAQRRALGKSAPESHPDFDGKHCVEGDCMGEIPPARLAMGKVRCVTCQSLLEERAVRKHINVRVVDD